MNLLGTIRTFQFYSSFFSFALSQLKIVLDFSYLATPAQAPPPKQIQIPTAVESLRISNCCGRSSGKTPNKYVARPVHFPIAGSYPSAQGPRRNVMRNCDTFIRRLSLRLAAAESGSVDLLRQMLLSIARRFCSPVSQANKRTQARRNAKR